jgi:hypothetical protein
MGAGIGSSFRDLKAGSGLSRLNGRSRPAFARVSEPSMPETLDFALIKRLREVLDRRPATETELRTLKEQAEGWQRAVNGQLEASERRLRRLNANPASSLAQIASELRRVEKLRPQLDEVRSLLGDLEKRSREIRTEWLLSQATSAKGFSRRPGGRQQ